MNEQLKKDLTAMDKLLEATKLQGLDFLTRLSFGFRVQRSALKSMHEIRTPSGNSQYR